MSSQHGFQHVKKFLEIIISESRKIEHRSFVQHNQENANNDSRKTPNKTRGLLLEDGLNNLNQVAELNCFNKTLF